MVDSKYYKDIKNIKQYAKENNIPIMQDEGISFLTTLIHKNKIRSILERGTAIGYSAIIMALTDKNIKITSVERDEKRYLEAVKNIKKFNLEDRITLIFKDALELKVDGNFDLIFLDAAKGQNINFFNNFSKNLNKNGFIVTDNMLFHGYVNKNEEDIKSRNLRGLVRKIKQYHEFLKTSDDYNTSFYNIGDGIAVTTRKK